MVTQKGAGYSLEAIVAVATVVIFVLGGLTIPENQDWNEFRVQASADDLTYALKDSGYLNHALSEGNVGSIQTAVSTMTERNVEVSGLISNLPIAENSVAFYTLPKDRFTQGLENVTSSDKCYGDLGEVSSRSEYDVLKTNGTGLDDRYDNETLYIGDLDPNEVGGNNIMDYDSVWVDNGTECQFSDEEGPHYLDEIVKWGNSSFDVEWVDGASKEMRLFNATQPVKINSKLQKEVNGVETFVNIDAVNFTEIANNQYNVFVLRSQESVDLVNGTNKSIVYDFMEEGSVLAMANLDYSNFESDDYLRELGFRYRNVSYQAGYSGGEISGVFSSSSGAQNTETYFTGAGGQDTDLSISPSGALSNTEKTLQSSKGLLHSTTESYEFSEWNRTNRSMKNVSNVNNFPGRPPASCYDNGTASLTNGSLEFPDGKNYSFINAELGTSQSYCDDNNERAVKIDLDGDGDYLDRDEGPFLNEQLVQVANRNYAVDIMFANSTSGCEEGDCLGFRYVGDNSVELVSRRRSFPNIENGERMALMGYESKYEEDDLILISSVIHWLRGDDLSFTGLAPPEGISTKAYSGIQDRNYGTYLPYELSLRWSR